MRLLSLFALIFSISLLASKSTIATIKLAQSNFSKTTNINRLKIAYFVHQLKTDAKL